MSLPSKSPEKQTSSISLVSLMGLPASGKSTLASKLPQMFRNYHVIVMSFDGYVSVVDQQKICNDIYTNSTAASDTDSFKSQLPTPASSPNIFFKTLRINFLECVRMVISLSKSLASSRSAPAESITELEGNFSLPNEMVGEFEKYHKSFFMQTKALVDELKTSMERNNNPLLKIVIVVDDNNYYHSMRNNIYQIAKCMETGYCLINCKASLQSCLERNSNREFKLKVPSSVIIEMKLKYEIPNGKVHLCDEYCLDVNTEEVNVDNFYSILEQFIEKSFSNLPTKIEDRTEEIESQKRLCSESEIHQADIILRKWISSQFKSQGVSSRLTASDKKKLSVKFNWKKKQTLEIMKKGKFKISHDITFNSEEFQNELLSVFLSSYED